MSLRVLSPGALTTVQDLGRFGYRRCGVPVAGAADEFTLRLANALVGNDEGDAALECAFGGLRLAFTERTAFAVAGGDLSPALNGTPIDMNRCCEAEPGDALALGACRVGLRAVIAFAGGLDVPLVMGSRSTYLRGGFGGFHGRALQKGDELSLLGRYRRPINLSGRYAPYAPPDTRALLRILPGAHLDRFAPDALKALTSGEYTVTARSDRMGLRLTGASLPHLTDANILSEAVTPGALQIPGDGEAILLLADAQTTGGYTVAANVISSDLSRAAQAKAGDRLSFQVTDAETARRAYLEKRAEIRALRERWDTPAEAFEIEIGDKRYRVRITPRG